MPVRFFIRSDEETRNLIQSEESHPPLCLGPREPFESGVITENHFMPNALKWSKLEIKNAQQPGFICSIIQRSPFKQPLAHTITTSENYHGAASFMPTTRREAWAEAAAIGRYSPRM